MKHRLPPWLVLLGVAALCGGLVFTVVRWRSRQAGVSELLRRVPADGAVLLYLDFRALRQAGVLELLNEASLAGEPEYRAFAEQSGFDFREDLDSALISFHRDGNFFLLRGRFAWGALERFVTGRGGECFNLFCRLQGSLPERKISYFPLRRDVMALAVSKDAAAAGRMQRPAGDTPLAHPPDRPLWMLVPVNRLREAHFLPAGTRLFAKALEGADRIVLSAGPSGSRLEIGMEVACRSKQDAEALTNQLRGLTLMLRALIAREGQKPNPRDLSGLLTAGVFTQEDNRVLGRWPVERELLEALAQK